VGILRESHRDTAGERRGWQPMMRLQRALVITALSLLAWTRDADVG
jgi:hypothetical protein